MLDGRGLADLIATLRRLGGEPSAVEVKSGAGGFPQSLRETLCAFSNTDGGLLIIGVDEMSGFQVIDLPDPTGYRDRLVSLASMFRDPVGVA